ncbi:MAG: hypothetical protein V3T20_00215 [Gemmatimonadota bacterium]
MEARCGRFARAARLVVGALAAVGTLSTPLTGQIAPDVAPYTLQVPGSIRGVGLNGAGVALVGDAGSVFSNPASLATIRHIALEGSYRPAPGEAHFLTGALGWRLRQFDIGVGGRYFDFGPDPTQYFGSSAPAGSNTREVLGVGSLVYRYGMIAVGVSGKYARRSVDSTHVRGFSADAGLAIAFFDIMALAFSVQNIAGNWREASTLVMPRLTRLGFTMNYVDPQETFRLLSTLEVQWPDGGSTRAVIGGEAGIVVSGIGVLARAGYGGGTPWLPDAGLTVGGTVQISAAKLDYAYRSKDILAESAHYFGIRLTL